MALLEQLDFLYMPSRDVEADLAFYTQVLGGDVVFAIEAFGARVARIALLEDGPALLVADHLEGDAPVLVHRVADLDAALGELARRGLPVRSASASRTAHARSYERPADNGWPCTSSPDLRRTQTWRDATTSAPVPVSAAGECRDAR